MNNSARVIGVLSLTALSIGATPGTGMCAAGVDLNRILSDWKERQKQTVSVSYELTGKRMIPKGIFSGDPFYKPNEIVPAADSVTDVSYKIMAHFDNHWFFVEKNFHDFYGDTRKFVPWYWLVLYDGAVMRHYEPKSKVTSSEYTPSAAHPEVRVATVKPEKLTLMFGTFDLPIFAAHGFVPSDPSFALSARKDRYVLNQSRFRLAGTGIIDGTECTIVKTFGDTQYEYWVDLSRQSSVLRARGHVNGAINFQLDIEQQKNKWGWVPAGWKHSLFATKSLVRCAESVTVKKVSVNLHLNKSQFQGKITAGMLIKHFDKGKHFQMQPDGSLKEVEPKMLLAQSASAGAWTTTAYVSLALVCAIVVLTVILFSRKKWRTRAIKTEQ